ncbi:hypothetical protein GCM10011507_08780 [Edaphobacter acidisoli]|uniref:Uncharacterized protein n=1 Tax=Edaphobacter acidisoli TaxID=2040573 RepID=A0A916W1G7_9BACT|nr:hypothetical protein GCM10011507_08780 [Edaphobacter acidisoli]
MSPYKWALYMGSQRAHIVLPDELVHEIDAMVGPRGRSAFLVETARAELRRRRLLSFLHNDQPAWHEKNHPELSGGAGPWVRELRQQSDTRTKAAKPKQKRAS